MATPSSENLRLSTPQRRPWPFCSQCSSFRCRAPILSPRARCDGTLRPRALAQRACFDCHTNATEWPWYSHIAPASFLVINHVNDGRRRLNFSEWEKPQRATLRDVEDNVTRGEMPIWNYAIVHQQAKLTTGETKQLLDGLQSTFLQDPPIPRRR